MMNRSPVRAWSATVWLACGLMTGAPVIAEDRLPLDELVTRLPIISYDQVQQADLPRVCNPDMMISADLMRDVGRPELGNTSDYPLVDVVSAEIDGNACRVEVNFQKYTPPGVTVTCMIKMFEFSAEMQRAVATASGGATCNE